jgi:uncharacterized protein YjdB
LNLFNSANITNDGIDPDVTKYLKFVTNATAKNLEVTIDGKEIEIQSVAATVFDVNNMSDDCVYFVTDGGAGYIYVPTALFENGAGSRSLNFTTKDLDNYTGNDSAVTEALSVNFSVDIKAKVLDDKIVHVNGSWIIQSGVNQGKNIGTVGGWCINDDDNNVYYIFSTTDLNNGNDRILLSEYTNVKYTDLKTNGYNSSGDIYFSNTKPEVCTYESGSLVAKQAGITKINLYGYHKDVKGNTVPIKGIEATIVVPYTNIGAIVEPIIMNVGNTYQINTTGGNLQGDPTSSNNDYIKMTGTTATAMKKTPTDKDDTNYTITVTAKMDSGSASFTSTEKAIMEALYGGADKAYSVIEYHFKVVDDLSLNTSYLTVGTDKDVKLTVNLTNTETVDGDDTTLKYPVTWTITNLTDSDGNDVQGVTQGTVTHYPDYTVADELNKNSGTLIATFHGVKVGYQLITATQTIDGVEKKATCTIQVIQSLTNITLDETDVTLYYGNGIQETEPIKATFHPDSVSQVIDHWVAVQDGKYIDITWNENDAYSATITALSPGTAYVYAVADDGTTSDYAKITVKSPITGITVTTPSNKLFELSKGDVRQIIAYITHMDGKSDPDDVITYKSTDKSVVTVDSDGTITCVDSGYANIILSTSGKYYEEADPVVVTVKVSTPVTSLSIRKAKEEIAVGEELSVTAVITPGNATDKTVEWTVDDASVVDLTYTKNSDDSVNLTVKGKSPGWAFITCKASDGFVETFRVRVKQPVEEITLNNEEMTVRKGSVFWLNAVCTPANADDKTVVWSSEDESICTVDSSGMVTAVAVGDVNIWATSADSNAKAKCLIHVQQVVDTLTLSETSITLFIDPNYNIEPITSSYGLRADIEPTDASNKRCTFVSTDPEIASVEASEDGRTAIITAVKGGNTVVTVTTEEGGIVQECHVRVIEFVTSVDITDDEKYLSIGKNAKLTATVLSKSATDKSLIWSSSDESICYVDTEGVVHGLSEGYAVITATAADGSGVSDTCLVQVVNPATSMTIEPSSVHLLYGSSTSDSAVLTAVIEPENATIKDVTWSSSNEAIATVDEGGEVFAMGVGNCTITATAADGSGIKATCKVRVTAAKNITSLKLNSKDIYMLVGKQRQLAVTVRPVAFTDTYDWYSTDTGIVTVNGSGLITTVGAGTADVVVESTENGVSSTCTVHSLGISRSTLRLEQYDSNDLDVLGIDSGDTVTWRSSNTRIATVDSSGHVVGRMSGTCTITAKTHDKTLTCTVTVFTAKKYN